jgi:hypothetical protein
MKPKILFFARADHAYLAPLLESPEYDSVLVTMTVAEKRQVEQTGRKVQACFEEEYDGLSSEKPDSNYLETSWSADRYLGKLSIQERELILGKEITFWKNILDTYQPILAINEPVAIEIAEVLYLEAKKRNIRYLAWMTPPIDNLFYFQTSAMHGSLSDDVFQVEPTVEDYEITRKYISEVIEGQGKPFYVRNLRSRYSLFTLLSNMYCWLLCLKMRYTYRNRAKSIAVFGDSSSIFRQKIINAFRSLVYRYDRMEHYANYEMVLYPMHFEPEATLKYWSEFYDNQAATIENIAKCLKLTQVLVVKEHPQQPGMLLTPPFQKLRKRSSNLVFLPAEVASRELIRQASFMITLTSTAGLEALIAGKPVIALGKVFFDKHSAVTTINNFEELREIIRQNKLSPSNPVNTLKFIAQLVNYCYSGNPWTNKATHSDVLVQKVSKAIEIELIKELNPA